jgi:hypothetical protein
MWVYAKIRQGSDLPSLYTVGYFLVREGASVFKPITDFDRERDAMQRVHYLNGGELPGNVEY